MTTPKLPFKFYIDLDPIAYAGSSSAQVVMYQWIRKEGEDIVEESPEFKKAVEAQQWIETECWEDEPADEGWERITKVVFKDVKDAFDATEEVLKDYFSTAKKFCRKGKEPKYLGWLTPKGHKDKDIEGLEDRYQHNREGVEKPKYLDDVREYLLKTYPTIFKMAKKGYEADTHVVGRAEAAGEDGCTMSIDKDIGQGEGCHHINMSAERQLRNVVFATELGELYFEKTHKGKEKTRGNGFKFLCYQAVVGDVSDGYKGLQGVGDKAAVKALQDCTTKLECLEAIRELYIKKSAKGYLCKKIQERNAQAIADGREDEVIVPEKGMFIYESWNGTIERRDVNQMMEQHLRLAYQERSPNDSFNLSDYFKEVPDEDYLD